MKNLLKQIFDAVMILQQGQQHLKWNFPLLRIKRDDESSTKCTGITGLTNIWLTWIFGNKISQLHFIFCDFLDTYKFKTLGPLTLIQQCACGGVTTRILNLDTRCRWMVKFTPSLYYLKQRAPRIGGWVSSRAGLNAVEGKKKNSCPF
jgi:hypothetical protein